VASASARLAETRIVSPLAGVVTAVEVQVGEAASALAPVISVLANEDQYKITLNLPEADVAKVQVGQVAEVTFDAFGDDQRFTAAVAFIDPAEQVIQGVVFYEATVLLDAAQDLRLLKPGMSANVTITTASRAGALSVPSRSVLEKDGVKYVRIPEGDSFREQMVRIGMRADGGVMEITDGLNEGETVIISIKAL
jgi:HlyD family secretion protein